jgi:hypothetical protein
MKITILADRLTWAAVDGTDTRIKRINLEASNGAIGRLIWEYFNDKPKFFGENMTEAQLNAGKLCAVEINIARLNKAASDFDIWGALTNGGWDFIFPV